MAEALVSFKCLSDHSRNKQGVDPFFFFLRGLIICDCCCTKSRVLPPLFFFHIAYIMLQDTCIFTAQKDNQRLQRYGQQHQAGCLAGSPEEELIGLCLLAEVRAPASFALRNIVFQWLRIMNVTQSLANLPKNPQPSQQTCQSSMSKA